MSIVQLSRFLSFFLSDSFNILPKLISFVKNFFLFLFRCSASFAVSSQRQLFYVITSAQRCQQVFSTVFPRLRFLFFRPLASGCPASASPADLIFCGFFGPVISDRCYLITLKRNCQRFSCFLFISDNLRNSETKYIRTLLYRTHLCRIKLTIHSVPV